MNELKARIRNAMTGPLCSIPTPFRPDEEIDFDALAKMIDFQIENHFGIIFLTPGNSHYNVLTDDEMAEIAKLDHGVRYYNRTDAQLVQFAAWRPTFEKS